MGIEFDDRSVSISPPNGYMETLPVTLGPTWQNNDVRVAFVSASGSNGQNALMMKMNPDPPSGFSAAYSVNPGYETHGVYYQRLATGATDASIAWEKPSGWTHFMFALLTARGVSPTSNPTAGTLTLTQVAGDTTATTNSVSVPGAGCMLFFAGTVQSSGGSTANWAVSLGVPTGWAHIVATDKSGQNFYQYDTSSALVVVGKHFTASGSTGSVAFPTAQGGPSFAGLWCFLPDALAVTGTIGAA